MRITINVVLGCLALLFGFVGCASGPQVSPEVTSAVTSRGVDSGTAQKIRNARVLDVQDIQNLVVKDVPTSTIVAYLESTRKVYNLSYGDLATLKSRGATPALLNYLTETSGFYGHTTPAQAARVSKEQKAEYYNTPGYQNEAPFAYNEPAVDDWYNSSYEESLYSPFSFN